MSPPPPQVINPLTDLYCVHLTPHLKLHKEVGLRCWLLVVPPIRFWTPEMEKRLREGVEKHGEKNWRAGECILLSHDWYWHSYIAHCKRECAVGKHYTISLYVLFVIFLEIVNLTARSVMQCAVSSELTLAGTLSLSPVASCLTNTMCACVGWCVLLSIYYYGLQWLHVRWCNMQGFPLEILKGCVIIIIAEKSLEGN